MGLGVVGGGFAIAGAIVGPKAKQDFSDGPTEADRNSASKRVDNANIMLAAGSISAGVLLTSGLIMTLTGVKKKKAQEQMAYASPFFSPGGGGLMLNGKF